MPFSSVLGASSAIKPGVCTSSTRPTVPYVGQLIFETDTNRLSVWNGSSWIYMVDADTPPGLELIKTQTIGTTVSSVEVTSAFSATYDKYLISISDGVASGNTAVNLTLGSTATGYYYAANYVSYNGASGVFSGANDTALKECLYASANAINCHITINNPYLSKRTFFNYETSGAQTSAVNLSTRGGGYLDNATSYTAFTLTTVAGTLTGGTIRVYGYRNS
jgi:hypothetical protein